jgi:hypothetical protein
MRPTSKTALLPPLFALLAACGGEPPPPNVVYADPEPGLAASPRWLTFTCVEPGCETTLVATINIVGNRDVAIRRVVVSDRERTDFEIVTSEPTPFVLKRPNVFEIQVTFKPDGDPRLGDVDVLVTYTDASANESEDRLAPGELALPLVRRLVGEAEMVVLPDRLVFGPVLPDEEKVLPVEIHNVGFGNIGLVLESVRTTLEDIEIRNLPENAILPGESWNLEIAYTPTDERFTEGELIIRSADPLAEPVHVAILGTSIARPALLLRPDNGISFGDLPVGTMGMRTLELINQGTEELVVQNFELTGQNLTFRLPRSATVAAIAPLESVEALITLDGQIVGPVMGNLRMATNDPLAVIEDVPISGLVTEPQIQVNPVAMDFGAVPRGWTVPRAMEIQNIGYGELIISDVNFLVGSSDLFTFRSLPAVPATLTNGQRLGFEVEFRSEVEASFAATLSVESNDPNTPSFEVQLQATGASCDLGCPISNGTPSCAAGVCAIGACNTGFYDSDLQAANGCECQEIGQDPGEFCAESIYLGQLDDDGDNRTFTGIIPTAGDIDIIRFHAKDSSQIFSDDFDVRITLNSADPGIQFCIYRFGTEDHQNECFFTGENCPSNRSYRHDGSLGREDGSDFTIKIYRTQSTTPSCIPYSVFMRNG